MKEYKAWSAERPPVWDLSSCPDKVYHHSNIQQKTVESDGETMTVYEYSVSEYTNKEYIALQNQRLDEQDNALIELAEMIAG